ncbi:MAG TPA: XdhC family protein [Candidatus Paceibacterota bacterium]|nr:XdhC family protein [Verrucomicrobiota bacterium]HRY49027.1 XdhC family protein [Candidatus Paceibacterota bacterium]HSA02417.1 XdhC family protein [Candidatus Paceibacterota bacterium]
MSRFYQLLLPLLESRESFALGLISGVKGSSPQKIGAKAAFLSDGRIIGTIGGGCLEAEIQDRARRALRTHTPATFELVLDHNFGWDDGLICGGSVSGLILPNAENSGALWRELAFAHHPTLWGVGSDFVPRRIRESEGPWLFQEVLQPPCQLWIAGSGHIAQAVTPLAQAVEFEVTVFDDRPNLANAEHFPAGTTFRVDYWDKLLEEKPGPLPTFGLIVTRGHQHDAQVLKSWIHQRLVFLGMIGSRRKARLIFTQFVDEAIASPEEMSRVNCPVGLEIHSETPAEIAVSIVAQLIKKRAEFMRESMSPEPESKPSLNHDAS